MTIAELRAAEFLLEDFVRRGLSLAEARREISFRILACEIHESSPDLTWDAFYEALWEKWQRFDEREETTI